MADPKKLRAWQHAMKLAVQCSRAADQFPPTERFALADQLRRAGYSVVLNIAEGAARFGGPAFRSFLDTSRASLDEIETILELAIEQAYVDAETGQRLQSLRDETARTVFGLLRAVSARQAENRKPRRGPT